MMRDSYRFWFGAAAALLVAAAFYPAWSAAQGSAADQASAAAWSADLPAVSDGRHLWTWANDADPKKPERRLTALYHADLSDEAPDGPAWELVTRFTGQLAPRGAAADRDTLYLVFEDRSVHRVSLRPGPVEGHWFFSKDKDAPLPADTAVRAAVAAHGKLWALVRVESAEALAAIDGRDEAEAAAENADDALNLVLGLPRELVVEDKPADAANDTAPSDGEASSSESTDEEDGGVANDVEGETQAEEPEAENAVEVISVPAERLLVLERGDWKRVGLPEGWTTNLPTRLVAPRRETDRPTLFVQLPTPQGPGRAEVFRFADEKWDASALNLPGVGGAVPLRVNDQLVLVQPLAGDAALTAQVGVVRGDRLTAIGEVALTAEAGTPSSGAWTAVRSADAVGVLAGSRTLGETLAKRSREPVEDADATGPTLAALDLRGEPTLGPAALWLEPEDPLAEAADMIILLGVVVTSTVLLFSFWRRDPTINELKLPEGVALADTMRRGLAGVIDLTPGLLVGTMVFELSLNDLWERWPGRGRGMTFGLMWPGIVAIGAVVAHTALLEISTGRSLGKFATGLRVTTLAGDRPRAWPLLVRCLLKSFDLVAYLLLILPIISPYRQRLGDMVAKTVVVMDTPTPPAPEGASPPEAGPPPEAQSPSEDRPDRGGRDE